MSKRMAIILTVHDETDPSVVLDLMQDEISDQEHEDWGIDPGEIMVIDNYED